MAFYTEERLNENRVLTDADFNVGFTDYLGATIRDAWHDNPTVALVELGEVHTAQVGRDALADLMGDSFDTETDVSEFEPTASPALSLEDQQARIKEAGLEKHVKAQEGYNAEALNLIMDSKREELERQITRQAASDWYAPAGFIAGLGTSMLDLINIASNFIPGVGQTRALRMLQEGAKEGAKEGARGLALRRAVIGAAEGAAGSVVVEPLVVFARSQQQADYGMTDSLLNVAFGTVMGATLHPAVGAWGDYKRRQAQKNNPFITAPWETVPPTDRTEALRHQFAQDAYARAQEAGSDMTEEQAYASAALFDARARTWAYFEKADPEEYYQQHRPEFEAAIEAAGTSPDTLFQFLGERETTVTPTRKDFYKNKTPLWERAQSNRSTEGTPSAVSGQNGVSESNIPQTDGDINTLLQRAWHGTPHNFDAFTLQAIGTGEGAQAHGWGLYFAQDRDVSEGYRRDLIEQEGLLFGDKKYSDLDDANLPGWVNDELVREQLEGILNGSTSREEAIATLRKALADEEADARSYFDDEYQNALDEKMEELDEEELADFDEEAFRRRFEQDWWGEAGEVRPELGAYSDAIDFLANSDNAFEFSGNRGQLFEVEIPDNDVLLDEQKTFNEQDENVKALLKKAFVSLEDEQKDRFFRKLLGKSLMESRETVAARNDLSAIIAYQRAFLLGLAKSSFQKYYSRSLLEGKGYSPEQIKQFEADPKMGAAEARKLNDEVASKQAKLDALVEADRIRTETILQEAKSDPEPVISRTVGDVLYDAFAFALTGEERNYRVASEYLNEHGIKGITYIGGRDGRCFVVFDDKAIQILDKLYQAMEGQAETPRGSVTFRPEDGKAVITFFKNTDASTLPHEMFHIFRRELAETAGMEGSSPQSRDMWAKVCEFVGAKEGEPWTREQEEMFARAGERYLLEGKAPNAQLRGVFERMKQWFMEIYHGLDAAGMEISDTMRQVFGDMFKLSPEEADMAFRYGFGRMLEWDGTEGTDTAVPELPESDDPAMQEDLTGLAVQRLEESLQSVADRPEFAEAVRKQAEQEIAVLDAEMEQSRIQGEILLEAALCDMRS